MNVAYSYEHSSSPGHGSTMRTFSLPPSSSSSSCSPSFPLFSSSFPLFSFASSVRATLLFDSLITSLSPPPPKLCNASSLANSTRVRCRGAFAGGLSVVVLETFSLWNQIIQESRVVMPEQCPKLPFRLIRQLYSDTILVPQPTPRVEN